MIDSQMSTGSVGATRVSNVVCYVLPNRNARTDHVSCDLTNTLENPVGIELEFKVCWSTTSLDFRLEAR